MEAIEVNADIGYCLLIDVAPRPVLTWLERLDHRMTGAVEVRRCVAVGGVVAASDAAA